jgi:acetyl esterase/lipase
MSLTLLKTRTAVVVLTAVSCAWEVSPIAAVPTVATLFSSSALPSPLRSPAAVQVTTLRTADLTSAIFPVSTYKEPPLSAPSTVAKVISSEKNITYCITGGTELKLDIFYPATPPVQKYPLLVWVHGGGLTGGRKEGFSGPIAALDGGSVYLVCGYAVASIDYRLGPQDKLPTMIEDAKCAIRFLRARASFYSINPDRIGVVGPSSGGYLAAMLGLADAGAGFEGRGAFTGISSRVQAVVAEFPQVSYELPSFSDAEVDSRKAVVPANADAKFLHDMSLTTYVSADDPPFLFFHGEFDSQLSPAYSQDLHARLVAAGVDSTHVLVKQAGHGWLENSPRLPNTPYGPLPSRQDVLKQELAFFDKHLKK